VRVCCAGGEEADEEDDFERTELVCWRLGSVAVGINLAYTTAKCLTRLIIGIGPEDSMLWFW
jgi:hypothetical protein